MENESAAGSSLSGLDLELVITWDVKDKGNVFRAEICFWKSNYCHVLFTIPVNSYASMCHDVQVTNANAWGPGRICQVRYDWVTPTIDVLAKELCKQREADQ